MTASYPNSVEYLYALGNELKPGAKFGLDRMRTFLAALGNPESSQRIIHVAGTNGKGSTCAMIASVLQAAGATVGLNTSPHLIAPTERIQVNGAPISKAEFAQAFDHVHAVAEQLLRDEKIDGHPSYFETVTAMALTVFQQRCDWTVLEVGLGGRLDATNVVSPALTVITPIAFDHEAFLGNTIELIASEKAGILKPGIPLVLAPQPPDAERTVLARADQLACPVILGNKSDLNQVAFTAFGSRFALHGVPYECPLPGAHQLENAMTAVLACQALGIAPGIIQNGLQATRWPGRLEYVSRHPDVVLDGAHNPAGAAALARYLRDFIRPRPIWIVYGTMRDKAIEEVAGQLFPLADRLIVTRPDMERALRPEAILSSFDHPSAVACDNLAEALAMVQSAPRDAVVFITGSLYLVGEARALLLADGRSLVK